MAEISKQSTIPESSAGRRLDQALAELWPEHSRSRIQQWIKAGCLLVEGKASTARTMVIGGERVHLEAVIQDQTHATAQAIDIDVLYRDDDLFVINKAAGMVVHPGAGNPDQTLLNALLHLDPGLSALPRAGLVHRLDKDTTGCLVVARTLSAHTQLVEQLSERDIAREYLAVCFGVPVAGGLIDVPIGRDQRERLKFCADETGRPSRTHFRVRERFRGHALLALKLETGRTHQIRVHLQYAGFPIVGDPLYGGRFKRPKGIGADAMAQLLAFKRQALHAFRIGLAHPRTCKALSVNAPLPKDLEDLVNALRSDAETVE
jgi:23S rRNA pseudouridine1911/1915/1917 synthase